MTGTLRKVTALLLTVCMMICVLAGCGSDGEKASSGGDDVTVEESADGVKSMTIGIDTPMYVWDPIMAQQMTAIQLNANLYGTLYSLDPDNQIKLDLAEKVDTSGDQLTWTITLRDTYWSNGDAVTADDFVYAWQRAADPTTGSQVGYMIAYTNMKNAAAITNGEMDASELGCYAADEKTIVMELEAPCPYMDLLLSGTAFSPVNRKFVEEQGENFAQDIENLIFAGPYKLTAWDSASNTCTIEKNGSYWDADNVDVDKISFQVVSDSQSGVMAYENGDLDYVEITGDLVSKYKDNEEFTTFLKGYKWVLYCNSNVVTNAKLREAISCSVDREALVNDVLQNGSVALYNDVMAEMHTLTDGSDFLDHCEKQVVYDEAKAKQLWSEAQAEGCQNSITIIYDEDNDAVALVAQYVAAQLESVLEGMTVTLKCEPKSTRVADTYTGNYEIVLFGWGSDFTDATAVLGLYTSDSIYNWVFWYNDEYDALISKANNEDALDESARVQDLVDAEALLAGSYISIPIYQDSVCCLIKGDIEGLAYHNAGPTNYWKYVTRG